MARQSAAIQARISTGHLSLTFEAPGFVAPLAITSRIVMFATRGVEEIEQQDIRVNGLALDDGAGPRLPLIEPERVASAPLAIELTDVYRYALAGTETVRGIECYAVRFEPAVGGRTLFRGVAWIAADDFGLVKVAATQLGLRGPIVSSDQVDDFTRVDGPWLLRESRLNQIYEGAAHRTPIERVITVERTEINPPDFDSRRAAALASPHVMVRDTPQGYRYIRREPGTAIRIGSADGTGSGGTGAAGAHGRLRHDRRSQHLLSVAVCRPQLRGLRLVRNRNSFNGFIGGTFGQLAFAIPSVAGSRWQIAGRAFAIASSFNDRSFDGGIERYDENIRQRPAQASVSVLRPLTPRVTLKARTSWTTPRMRVPRRPRRSSSRPRLRPSTRRASRSKASVMAGRRAPRGLPLSGSAGRRGDHQRATTARPSTAIFNVSARRSPALPSSRRASSSAARLPGWTATISIVSVATRSARSTTACTVIPPPAFDTIAGPLAVAQSPGRPRHASGSMALPTSRSCTIRASGRG